MTAMNWSTYQLAVFDWIEHGTGHAVAEAVAGSGKTTLLIEAAARIDSRNAAFLAFNRSVANTLNDKFERAGIAMQAKTLHSAGAAAIGQWAGRRNNVKQYKYWDIIERLLLRDGARIFADKDARKQATRQLAKLWELMRLTLSHDELATMEHYGIYSDNGDFDLEDWLYLIPEIEKAGIELALDRGMIDFADMLWLPAERDMSIERLDWLLVDEAQDLSNAALAMTLKMIKRNGRLLYVGDRNQAIYGFAGAGIDSIEQIFAKTNATSLPLSITYRCPTAHVELAQNYVPAIEAAPWAETGELRRIDRAAMLENVRAQDLILCRFTAPLVKECFEMLASGQAATIIGRDIASQLANVAKAAAKHAETWGDMQSALIDWQRAKIEQLLAKNPEASTDHIEDTAQALSIFVSQSSNLDDLLALIRTVFNDKRALIKLSTIHRAKGLESERVFYLQTGPARAVQDWQQQQEQNLRYVAVTRSKRDLFLVDIER